jgi:hypothetical protein
MRIKFWFNNPKNRVGVSGNQGAKIGNCERIGVPNRKGKRSFQK